MSSSYISIDSLFLYWYSITAAKTGLKSLEIDLYLYWKMLGWIDMIKLALNKVNEFIIACECWVWYAWVMTEYVISSKLNKILEEVKANKKNEGGGTPS